MSKPILYGLHLSAPCRAVLLVAKAIDLDLEIRHVNLFANEHKTPEYLKMNPQGIVPTLDDNGVIIWDSHAIVTYLVDKYASDDSLFPKDLAKRAQINQRLHFDHGILFVRLRSIIENIMNFNEPNIPERMLLAMEQSYQLLDKFLENDPYLCGDSITVADMCCIATFSTGLGILPLDVEKYSKIGEWVARLEELPYYEEINGQYAKQLIGIINHKIEELNQ